MTDKKPNSDQRIVVLDVGHGYTPGGYDHGAAGTLNGKTVTENEINKRNADFLEKELTKRGYFVVRTDDQEQRSTNPGSNFKTRFNVAYKNSADLYISIHANASSNSGACGTWICATDNASDETLQAASHVKSSLKNSDVNVMDRLYMLEQGHTGPVRGIQGKVPGFLVEAGFVTNKNDLEKMTNDSYTNKFAGSIADGVDNFFSGKQIAVNKDLKKYIGNDGSRHGSHGHNRDDGHRDDGNDFVYSSAVKDFQVEINKLRKQQGLKAIRVDGLAGEETWNAALKSGVTEVLAAKMNLTEDEKNTLTAAAEKHSQKEFIAMNNKQDYLKNAKASFADATVIVKAKSIGKDINADDIALSENTNPQKSRKSPALS